MKLSNNISKQHWDKFTQTGLIKDYLNYKFAKKKEEAYETNTKEKRNYPKI